MTRSCNDNTDMAEVLALITNIRESDINQNVMSKFENQLKNDQQTLITERKIVTSSVFFFKWMKTDILMFWFF